MSVAAQFAQACSALAKSHGVAEFVILLKEPGTGTPKVLATPGSLADGVFRATAAEQFKLRATQVAAGGACPRCPELEAKCARLEAEMASLGGDTGWG